MVEFVIGDWVAVVDEVFCGRVTRVEGETVTLVTPDGFSLHYCAKDLVKMEAEIKVSSFEVARAKSEKELTHKKPAIRAKSKRSAAPLLEVDLHSHRLKYATQHLSAFEILKLQLQTAQRQLELTMARRIQKMVFIHGVGKGVLKLELYALFNRYEGLTYYDADSKKYGLGATEVYLFQNT